MYLSTYQKVPKKKNKATKIITEYFLPLQALPKDFY